MMWVIVILGSLILGYILYQQEKVLENSVEEIDCDDIDELNDEVTPEESEIMAQEKLVDMYYHVWLHEHEKLAMIPSYKRETDAYYKQWKKTSEAEARYIKAEARLSKLKSKNDIHYVVTL